ncbi:MAG: M23 family metallopeptidase [Candidatus Hydrogenedentes bacterium]|nr:M23 family metallopeptidase [Candidatus Hydrogenedentota bacterium]
MSKSLVILSLELMLCVGVFTPSLVAEFHPPLKPPLYITSSFGEYRYSRFHMGVDFRAGKGTPVYAVDDGYVARIRCGPWGYGKAIYVHFNNGFIGVYAHLDQFAEPYQTYIRKIQYEKKSFSVDMPIGKDELTVKKGQVIAYAGNSGTQHPHLHFEIRDVDGVTCLNPRDFGFEWVDVNPPLINSLLVVPGNASSTINGRHLHSEFPLSPSLSEVSLRAKGEVSFGVEVYDPESGGCKLGPYRITIKEGAEEICGINQSRVDYKTANSGKVAFYPYLRGREFWVLWRWEGNDSPNYCLPKNSFYTISDKERNFEISVADFYGRSSAVNLKITPEDLHINPDNVEVKKEPGVYIHYLYNFVTFEIALNRGNKHTESPKISVFDFSNNVSSLLNVYRVSKYIYEAPWSPTLSGKYKIKIIHPEFTSWEREIYTLKRGDTLSPIEIGELKIKLLPDTPFHWIWFFVSKESIKYEAKGMSILSNIFTIEPDFIPIDNAVELEFTIGERIEHLNRVSVYRFSGGKWSRVESRVGQDKVSAKVDVFGKYAIFRDDSPPRIMDISIKNNMVYETKKPKISCKVSDIGSGVASANIYCDNEWLLGEYDGPRGILKWSQDKELPVGEHTITLEVIDYAGLVTKEKLSIIVQEKKNTKDKNQRE